MKTRSLVTAVAAASLLIVAFLLPGVGRASVAAVKLAETMPGDRKCRNEGHLSDRSGAAAGPI